MGYYTYYSLEVSGITRDKKGKLIFGDVPSVVQEDLEDEIDKLDVFVGGDIDYGWESEFIKWYDYEDDMLTLSHRFPDILFTLYGNGEDDEDMWCAYYYDGAVQNAPAVISYDKFDENKLVKSNKQELFSPNRKYTYETQVTK